jgi:diguanylate cyclase (GGDEF)-like protein/PAS domain S-box-containing protein
MDDPAHIPAGFNPEAILAGLSDQAILVVDLERTVLYFSPGAEYLHGRSADEVVGRPLETALSLDETSQTWQALKTSVLENKKYELTLPGRDHRTVLRYTFFPFRTELDRAVEAIVGIGRDITYQSRIETDLTSHLQAAALKNELTSALIMPAAEFGQKINRVSHIICQELEVRHCSIMLVRRDRIEVIGATNPKLIGQTQELGSATVSAEVVRTGRGLIHNDGIDSPTSRLLTGGRLAGHHSRSFICIPLINRYEVPLVGTRGQVVGVINLNDKVVGQRFTDQDMNKLTEMAETVSAALILNLLFEQLKASHAELLGAYETVNRLVAQLQGRNQELEETRRMLELAQSELLQMSVTDDLTQIHNFRYFREALEAEIKRVQRYDAPLSLLMIDIDHFKHYNDQNGHLAGDEVLKELARILKEKTRTTDVVARYGGEEFAVVLLETERDEALTIAERIRAAVEAADFANQERQPLGNLTVSLGVAEFGVPLTSYRTLINAADQALYTAKHRGRNQVVTFEPHLINSAAAGWIETEPRQGQSDNDPDDRQVG